MHSVYAYVCTLRSEQSYTKKMCLAENILFNYSCCVSCNKGQCDGTCLGRESDCKSGYYMEPNKCIEDDCVCCIPCSVTAKCLANKGYPERNTTACKGGYKANAAEAGPGCVCCQPSKRVEFHEGGDLCEMKLMKSEVNDR